MALLTVPETEFAGPVGSTGPGRPRRRLGWKPSANPSGEVSTLRTNLGGWRHETDLRHFGRVVRPAHAAGTMDTVVVYTFVPAASPWAVYSR